MSQINLWLTMGGYGMYIWPAYGITCFILIVHIIDIRHQRKRIHKKLRQWLQR